MGRDVRELSENELEELKTTLFYELLDNGTLGKIANGIDFPWEIPNEIVYDWYEGIYFVDDDFFCNINA